MLIFSILIGVFTLIGAAYAILSENYFLKGLTKARKKELGILNFAEVIFRNPFTIFIFLVGWIIAGALFSIGIMFGVLPFKEGKSKRQGKTFIFANAIKLTLEDVEKLCKYYNMTPQETVGILASVQTIKINANNQ